jgi:16S rRNA (cytosine967-C5)-methyltransferase
LALTILQACEKRRQSLDSLFEENSPAANLADARDRALLQTLIFGVLRWRRRLDWIIGHYSNTPLRRIDPRVLNILRIGVYQILFLDRIPHSAAVNTAVQLSKACAPGWVTRFVNGLLRNIARQDARVAYPDPKKEPIRALALRQAFPDWLAERWIQRWGYATARELCEAINTIPPLTVRANTLKTSRARLLESLVAEASEVEATLLAPDGIRLHKLNRPVGQIPAYHRGWFQVQDEAAQLVAPLLQPAAGLTVLDACCGRGGKTGHLAQLMSNRGRLFALDREATRLQQLEAVMQRLGVTIVQSRRRDLYAPLRRDELPAMDRILLDAPCSGLGVLRRNPDGKWSGNAQRLQRHGRRQLRLLANVAPLLKPGGVLVYAVCSLEPEESTEVVEAFLKKHPLFVIEKHPSDLLPGADALFAAEGWVRTLPGPFDMDGFFIAALRRIE